MATVIFYEKPGCINNTKQKALLKAAGHDLEVRNLLAETWTAESLRSFFGQLPVADWFNRSAPKIKSQEVIPEQIDTETALSLMLQDRLLIRRPLMQVGDRREVGFDVDRIDKWIGLQPIDASQRSKVEDLTHQDLQTCPNSH
ncbi:ArsC/Spx/MgsR family protein [Pseudanabaena sp. PCC 6802]|uniref:ArsC/Spx/MgsR family protein n=1 Tax=Pseudanabaena sp. PCC 6802 TaxID=118173 RepID=UPI00034B24B5|nr:ArsC/Spx/MgsR family protein [Pseudanabaena sp. PCC 6802]